MRTVCQDLSTSGASFALVGGLAVSACTEPRFTKDVDLAVAVGGDREAQTLIKSLRARGYGIQAILEQEAVGRLATVRLTAPGVSPLFVDILFASSGIEPEVVQASRPVEVIEGLTVRVASLPHLIALKVLSRDDVRRPQDRADLVALLGVAREADIAAAREALRTIHARGFHRGKDLLVELESLIRR
ncbi:MAG: nucleotidyl transferase AbiEii/AbiGii toxin family protein [Planctomycetes bacterium]|nr:nucleotidyl transferase AbiEii/AbiGii toxin family protein [Planctomycetota bacterium]